MRSSSKKALPLALRQADGQGWAWLGGQLRAITLGGWSQPELRLWGQLSLSMVVPGRDLPCVVLGSGEL